VKGLIFLIIKRDTNEQRKKRHRRVRYKISGTPGRPRLNVFRSEKHIYAQVIDDTLGTTLCSASSVEKEFKGSGSNKEGARKVGKAIAERAIAKGINNIVFDRGGYIYHGRVKELADAAREGGLTF
jgi:large subunit ribosomal protein L18